LDIEMAGIGKLCLWITCELEPKVPPQRLRHRKP
jgi:hypothetical protein